MNNIKTRLKDRPTLLAILAWLYSILELSNVLDVLPANTWEIVVLGGVNILVILGVVNNPTSESKWYKDDKPVNTSRNI